MSKPPVMPCRKCGGSGVTPIPDWLTITLKAMPKGAGSVTALQLAATLESIGGGVVGATAVNNRLEKLRSIGLVTRKRNGKFWNYQRAR